MSISFLIAMNWGVGEPDCRTASMHACPLSVFLLMIYIALQQRVGKEDRYEEDRCEEDDTADITATAEESSRGCTALINSIGHYSVIRPTRPSVAPRVPLLPVHQ